MILRPSTVDGERAARRAHVETKPEGFRSLRDLRDDEPWVAYVDRLDGMSGGLDVQAGKAPLSWWPRFAES